MTQSVATGQTDVFVTLRLITDATNNPATGVVAATGGHVIWYRRDGAAVVTDSGAAADLASLTTAHTDWEFLEIRNGQYTVAFPDAAFAAGVAGVLCGMEATGISCEEVYVTIDPLFKFKGLASAATSTTTTFPAGPTVYKGDSIYVAEGTGIGQTRLITSATGQVATHAAFDVGISTSASTIILIPGDATLADGGINVDAAVSTRSSHTQANVRTEMDASNAEGCNITQINGTTVQGDGTVGNLWRG
jgi:hypothetical protein